MIMLGGCSGMAINTISPNTLLYFFTVMLQLTLMLTHGEEKPSAQSHSQYVPTSISQVHIYSRLLPAFDSIRLRDPNKLRLFVLVDGLL